MKYHHNARGLFVLAAFFVSLLIPFTALAAEPNITKITPDSGSVDGGRMITVTGENFMGERREQFTDIAAGVQHLVMLSASHHVWTMGCNEYGQLGAGLLTTIRTKCQSKPVDITDKFGLTGDDYIESIASGDYSSFAISRSHRVFAWGKNKYGELGDGSQNDSNVPVEITGNFDIDNGDYIYHIESGVDLSMAQAHSGKVFIWGDRRNRQDGRYNDPVSSSEQMGFYTKPTYANWLVGDGDRSWGMSIGNHSAILLTERDRVYTWGRNTSGELGRSKPGAHNNVEQAAMSNNDIYSNLDLSEDDEPTQVEAGNGVMAVLTKLGRVLIWGNDEHGMLGLNGEIPNSNDKETGNRLSSSPIDITDNFTLPDYEKDGKKYPDKIAQISVGNSHALALSQYGRVFSWGADNYGQLGDGENLGHRGDIEDITDKFELVSDDAIIEKVVAAGSADANVASYSFALDSDGNVYAWGGSAAGNTGINAVAGLQNVPSRASDRLMARVPLVSEVDVDDTPAKLDVVSDKKLRFILPEGNEPGPVDVSLINSDGDEIRFEKAFTYTESKDADTSGATDDDKANGDAKDGNKSDDKVDEKGEDKNADTSGNDTSNVLDKNSSKLTDKSAGKLLSNQNKASSTLTSGKSSGSTKASSSSSRSSGSGSTKSAGSTKSGSSSSKIAAPNTGAY